MLTLVMLKYRYHHPPENYELSFSALSMLQVIKYQWPLQCRCCFVTVEMLKNMHCLGLGHFIEFLPVNLENVRLIITSGFGISAKYK